MSGDKNMTREEFYKKYGDVEVVFSSFYKHSFYYKAELLNGDILTCSYGGNPDEIYRHEVCAGVKISVRELEPFSGTVLNQSGEEIESFYDY